MIVGREQLGENTVAVHRVQTADQTPIALTRLERPNAAADRTPVLFAHGTFSNRTIWLSNNGKGLAPDLAAAGYDCWILEVRGHGQAQLHGMKPRSTSFDTWINHDTTTALDYVYRQTGRPVFWIGHSAGGVMIYAHLARYPEAAKKLRGIVTFGSQALHSARTLKGRAMVYFTWSMIWLCGYFPARRLGLGPDDEFQGVLNQWAHWNLRRQWHSLDGYDYQAGLPQIKVPALALAGGGDQLLAPEPGCRALFDALGSPDKQFIIYAQANGHAEDYDHTTLIIGKNAQKEIWPEVKKWLDRH